MARVDFFMAVVNWQNQVMPLSPIIIVFKTDHNDNPVINSIYQGSMASYIFLNKLHKRHPIPENSQ